MTRSIPDLKGSIPPLVCPFTDGKVDIDAFVRLVERQVGSGSSGVVVNGTTGEPSTLTLSERKLLAEAAIHTAGDRLTVIVATGSQSHAETVELTEHAAVSGASAVLIVTPYYIRPSQQGLIEYFVDVAARTDLPVLVYHIPSRAAVGVTVGTLAAIRERADNVIGIKHAVDDLGMVTDMVRVLGPSFRIFAGLEELSFPMLAVGAAGTMSAVGNVAPGLVAELCAAVERGDLLGARAAHYNLTNLNRAVFYDTNPIPIKYMLRRLGLLDSNQHRLPLLPASAELEARLDAVLREAGLLEQPVQ